MGYLPRRIAAKPNLDDQSQNGCLLLPASMSFSLPENIARGVVMRSLSDPPPNEPIADGMAWLQGVALGPAATSFAVIAVAAIGLLMLSGRLELRRGITVVIGCFILLGAPSIAAALTGVGKQTEPLPRVAANRDSALLSEPFLTPETRPSAYDPYAGVSAPTAR